MIVRVMVVATIGRGVAARKNQTQEIVVLVGARATQAEAQHLGASQSPYATLSHSGGVTTRIPHACWSQYLHPLALARGVDIEKLISLLALAVYRASRISRKMRFIISMSFVLVTRRARVLEIRSCIFVYSRCITIGRFESEVETCRDKSRLIMMAFFNCLSDSLWRSEFGAIVCFRRLCTSNFSVNRPRCCSFTARLPGDLESQFRWRCCTKARNIFSYRLDPTYDTEKIEAQPLTKLSASLYELLAERCDVLR